jgi:hypothetical protein
MKKISLTVLFLALLAPALPAQPSVSGAQWQLSKAAGQKRLPYLDVEVLKFSRAGAMQGRPRVVLTVSNPSASPAEGLVLRYDFSISVSSAGGAGVWTVPFHVGETRVSRLAPRSGQKVNIYQANLGAQLARLRGTGFRPTALKIRVMTEPRAGDDLSLLVREFEIPFEEAE